MKTRRASPKVATATPKKDLSCINDTEQKVVGYVRVSTEKQSADGVSIAAQTERIRAWSAVSWPNRDVVIFTDEGLSGMKKDRPGLAAAMAAVRPGDVLVGYSLSRLSRSRMELLTLADDLQRRGVDLASVTERIDTTGAAGKMVFGVLAVIAEFERDLAAERTKAAMAHLRKTGRKTGGHRPIGYDVTADGHLVVNAVEQAKIAKARRMRRRGASLRTIAKAAGLGHAKTVKRILAYPARPTFSDRVVVV